MTTPAQHQPEPAAQNYPTTPVARDHRLAGHTTVDDGSSAELTAHAAHLRRLSDRIDHLADELANLRAHTDQLTTIATDIQHTLDLPPPPQAPEAGPPCWPTMTAEDAAAAWEALADWIADTLVPWYGITRGQLPDCWARHPPVVAELSWLHHTHHAAHQPGAPAHLVADWHTHWKPTALHHIHNAVPHRGHRTCTPGHHLATDTERTPHPPATPPIPTTGYEPRTPPTEQPAVRHHWYTYYQRAVTDDLANRDA